MILNMFMPHCFIENLIPHLKQHLLKFFPKKQESQSLGFHHPLNLLLLLLHHPNFFTSGKIILQLRNQRPKIFSVDIVTNLVITLIIVSKLGPRKKYNADTASSLVTQLINVLNEKRGMLKFLVLLKMKTHHLYLL